VKHHPGRWNTQDHVFAKLTVAYSAPTGAGGVCQFGINPNDASACSLWSKYAGMYDAFRVRGLKITWIPRTNMSYSSGGTLTDIYNVPVYVFMDLDNNTAAQIANITSPALALAYAKCKVRESQRAFKCYFPNPAVTLATSGTPTGWLNCQVAAPNSSSVMTMTYDPQRANYTIADVIATYYVEFNKQV
jgi:hypothetical protein